MWWSWLLQVLVQGMLTQLWAPLVSVGGLYLRLRKVRRLQSPPWHAEWQTAALEVLVVPVLVTRDCDCFHRQRPMAHEGRGAFPQCLSLASQSLVDLEDFIHVLREQSQPREGPRSQLPEWPPPAEQHSSSNGAHPAVLSSAAARSTAAASSSASQASHSRRHTPAALQPRQQSSACEQHREHSSSSDTPAPANNSGLHLELRDVCFCYSQAGDPDGAQALLGAPAAAAPGPARVKAADAPMQLRGVSFKMQPGEAIGIVGPPGARSGP